MKEREEMADLLNDFDESWSPRPGERHPMVLHVKKLMDISFDLGKSYWQPAPEPVTKKEPAPELVTKKESPHHRVIREWDQLFQQYRGHKPTWRAKQTKLVKDLLRVHDVVEICRRIHVAYEDPPKWPPNPDFAAFAQHFDLFTGSPEQHQLSIDEIMEGL